MRDMGKDKRCDRRQGHAVARGPHLCGGAAGSWGGTFRIWNEIGGGDLLPSDLDLGYRCAGTDIVPYLAVSKAGEWA